MYTCGGKRHQNKKNSMHVDLLTSSLSTEESLQPWLNLQNVVPKKHLYVCTAIFPLFQGNHPNCAPQD